MYMYIGCFISLFQRETKLARETRVKAAIRRKKVSIHEETQLSTVEPGTSSKGVATIDSSGRRRIYFFFLLFVLLSNRARLDRRSSLGGDRNVSMTRRGFPSRKKFSESRKTTRAEEYGRGRRGGKGEGHNKSKTALGEREERQRERERFSRWRVWHNERKRGRKKRSSKLTAASGKPNATGSPLCPKNLPSFFVPIPRFERLLSSSLSHGGRAEHTFSLVPLVVHLEARQMSGIRLRHLSVSPFVTFDSRQIDEREKGTKTNFLSWPRRR